MSGNRRRPEWGFGMGLVPLLSVLLLGPQMAMAELPSAAVADSTLTAALPVTLQTSGLFYLYGKALTAPYVVTWSEGCLFLDGIQIEPQLPPDESKLPPDSLRHGPFMMVDRARQETVGIRDEELRCKEIRRIIMEDPTVDTCTVYKLLVWVRLKSGESFHASLRGPGHHPPPPKEDLVNTPTPISALTTYRCLQRAANDNSCVFMGRGYVYVVDCSPELKEQIRVARETANADTPGPLTPGELKEIIDANR